MAFLLAGLEDLVGETDRWLKLSNTVETLIGNPPDAVKPYLANYKQDNKEEAFHNVNNVLRFYLPDWKVCNKD